MANAYTETYQTNALPKYYDKKFIERLFPNCKMINYCEMRPLPLNSGTSMFFEMVTNTNDYTAASGKALTQGTVLSTTATSDTQVSAVIEQFGSARGIWDLTELTAINSLVTANVEEQADLANKIIDLRIIEEAMGTSSRTSGDQGAGFPVIAFNTNSGAEDGRLTTSSLSSSIAAVNTTEYRLTSKTLRYGVASLAAQNVPTFDDGLYALICRSNTAYRLMADSEWQAAYQYTDPENMRKGIAGAAFGAKIVIDNNIFASAMGSGASTKYFSILLGKGAIGASELDGGVKTYTKTSGPQDTSNPINQFSTFGWKANFVAKRLNVSSGVILVTAD